MRYGVSLYRSERDIADALKVDGAKPSAIREACWQEYARYMQHYVPFNCGRHNCGFQYVIDGFAPNDDATTICLWCGETCPIEPGATSATVSLLASGPKTGQTEHE